VGLYVLRRRIKRGKLLRRRPSTIVPPDVD
jgi:hypothetical protein